LEISPVVFLSGTDLHDAMEWDSIEHNAGPEDGALLLMLAVGKRHGFVIHAAARIHSEYAARGIGEPLDARR
jgi:hypothetical protein